MPGYAKEAWKFFRDDWPMTHPADSYWLNFREIADRPVDAAQAWGLLYGIVITHVERLEKLLAERLDLESVPHPDWTDRAAMDLSREFERHRRYQSAKMRELLRTIEAYRKLRKASADGMADDKCQMADGMGQMTDGTGQMADGTCQMADDKKQMADGECEMTNGDMRELGRAYRPADENRHKPEESDERSQIGNDTSSRYTRVCFRKPRTGQARTKPNHQPAARP